VTPAIHKVPRVGNYREDHYTLRRAKKLLLTPERHISDLFGERVGGFVISSNAEKLSHDELFREACTARYLAERDMVYSKDLPRSKRLERSIVMALMANSPYFKDVGIKPPHFEEDARRIPWLRVIRVPTRRNSKISEKWNAPVLEGGIRLLERKPEGFSVKKSKGLSGTITSINFTSPLKGRRGESISGSLLLKGTRAGRPVKGVFKFIRDADRKGVMRHLSKVYEQAMQAEDKKSAADNIAEYEWFMSHLNPMKRGGHSLGTMMSAAMCKAKGLGWGTYKRLDYEAMTTPLEEYKKARAAELIR